MPTQFDIPIPIGVNKTVLQTTISASIGYGTHALRPAAATKLDGSVYVETDTGSIYQVQTAAWAAIAVGNVFVSNTLLAAPLTGQMQLHIPTGRTVLYFYDGTKQAPIRSFGTMALYVDPAGTDDLAHGTGVAEAAFATHQFAYDMIPPIYDGDVTITASNNTFNERITLSVRTPTKAPYFIKFVGTMAQTKAGTAAAGSVLGASAVQGTLVDNAGGMGVDAHKDKIIHVLTGGAAGQYRVIDSNTATTFTIAGTWYPGTAPAAGDTYEVLNWGTKITGDYSIWAPYPVYNVIFYNYDFAGSLQDLFTSYAGQILGQQCRFNDVIGVEGGAQVVLWDSFYKVNTAGNTTLHAADGGRLELIRGKMFAASTPIISLWARGGGIIYLSGGTILDGNAKNGNIGCYSSQLGSIFVDPDQIVNYGHTKVRNWQTGVNAVQLGMFTGGTAGVDYTNNTVDHGIATSGYYD